MIKGTGNKYLPIVITLITLVCSCSRNTIYTDTITMPSEVWTIDNVTNFNAEITDTAAISNIFFSIRTGTAYPFRNVWLFVNTTSPSGRSITDTLQYMLADDKGRWFGKGFGDVHELSLPFRTGIYFPEKGNYSFRIRHGMRAENLKGVYDFGLRIEKIKK